MHPVANSPPSFPLALGHSPSHMEGEGGAASMARASGKAQKGIGMEGFIASWYARQTAHDSAEFQRTARQIAAHLSTGSRVLEIAPGPGYLAVEIAKLTAGRVTGLDISHSFVRIAQDNARKAGVNVD